MAQEPYATPQEPSTSGQTEVTTADGWAVKANAGERSLVAAQPVEPQMPAWLPGSAKVVDVGAQVGILRNLEFSAGGRAHRISTGPYTKA